MLQRLTKSAHKINKVYENPFKITKPYIFNGLILQCVLSAVVLMSLRGMFLQYTELPSLWRKSKIDFVSLWLCRYCSLQPQSTTHTSFDYLVYCNYVLLLN